MNSPQREASFREVQYEHFYAVIYFYAVIFHTHYNFHNCIDVFQQFYMGNDFHKDFFRKIFAVLCVVCKLVSKLSQNLIE